MFACLFILEISFYFMCIDVLPVCVYLQHVHEVLVEALELDGCEPLCESILDPVEEQPVFFIAEPSL